MFRLFDLGGKLLPTSVFETFSENQRQKKGDSRLPFESFPSVKSYLTITFWVLTAPFTTRDAVYDPAPNSAVFTNKLL